MRYFPLKDKLGRQTSEHNNYDLLVRIFSTIYLLLWPVDRDRMCLDQRVLGRVGNTHFLHQVCVEATKITIKRKKAASKCHYLRISYIKLVSKKFKQLIIWRKFWITYSCYTCKIFERHQSNRFSVRMQDTDKWPNLCVFFSFPSILLNYTWQTCEGVLSGKVILIKIKIKSREIK